MSGLPFMGGVARVGGAFSFFTLSWVESSSRISSHHSTGGCQLCCTSLEVFFICNSLLLFLSLFVSVFSDVGLSDVGLSVMVFLFIHVGFPVMGVSYSVYSMSRCHLSFFHFVLCRYHACSSSLIPLVVESLPSDASLRILSIAKSRSSGLLWRYQNSHFAFRDNVLLFSRSFGMIPYLLVIFSFAMNVFLLYKKTTRHPHKLVASHHTVPVAYCFHLDYPSNFQTRWCVRRLWGCHICWKSNKLFFFFTSPLFSFALLFCLIVSGLRFGIGILRSCYWMRSVLLLVLVGLLCLGILFVGTLPGEHGLK